MAYYHVIAKIGSDNNYRIIFNDLTKHRLHKLFINPYEKGTSFFSGNDLISPHDLKSLKIICTEHSDEIEREEMHSDSLQRIDRLNQENSSFVILSGGSGYNPEDISEAGDDVTDTFINGTPGFKAGVQTKILRVLTWIAGIIGAIIAAGIVKWLGWV